ncbi:MAG: RluA family pseudouridine synthase [Rubrivivax sp.]
MLNCVHADEHLLVFDKPSGLLSVPGRGPERQDCLSARAQTLWPDALIVHRLDMATSGLLLMARGAAMQRLLSEAFAKRRVGKRYVAVVQGQLAADSGSIDAPLILDWPNRPRQIVDSVHGKASLTHWQVLARAGAQTRLALEPVTGRSHQLRVHLASIGHPILGDELYGDAGSAPRLLLHACTLVFVHPAGGQLLQLRSEPPF